MKIGLITPGGFDRSGQERVIPAFLWLVERLARRHEVHVYTLYQYPDPVDYALLGASVHNIGGSDRSVRALRRFARTLRALQGEQRRGRFDVLHGLWANESGLIAAAAGKLWGIPSVVTMLGGELVALPDIGYGGQLRRNGRWITRGALRLAGAVTVQSAYAQRLVQPYRPDTRVITIGVDTERFAPSPSPVSDPSWRLLHVASLNRVKDQPTLLHAIREIHAVAPEARLDIIGEDTLGGAMQRLAIDLGLEVAVTFHGFQPSEIVACFLQRSHLLLHSSRHEAGPLALLEAAACGVPGVGTAVGHFADLAPESAVAMPIGDASALACAALNLLQNADRRHALGQCALTFARTHNADWTAEQFEMLYSEV